MPLGGELNQLKNKLKDLNRKYDILPIGQNKPQAPPAQQQPPYPQQQWPQQQYQQPGYPGSSNQWPNAPPPIPDHSRPGGSSAPQIPSQSRPNPSQHDLVYWRADFRPSAAVAAEWEHKEGNGHDGWGNQELEHYSASPENSFYTPHNQLILRAIARPSAPAPEQRYISARLVSRRTLSRSRGCLTAHIILPCAEGIWPAFWLLPREPFVWPHDGEVDIAETWNGDCQNHSCLHWGFYTPEDWSKHLVQGTHIPDMARRPVRFDFVWDCEGAGVRGDGKANGGGRLMWYIDGRPVMKNLMPEGTRPIEDWVILLNVAMGGNVCQGKVPREGTYDMVVQWLQLASEPEGGWGRFEADWPGCVDGHVM